MKIILILAFVLSTFSCSHDSRENPCGRIVDEWPIQFQVGSGYWPYTPPKDNTRTVFVYADEQETNRDGSVTYKNACVEYKRAGGARIDTWQYRFHERLTLPAWVPRGEL